MKTTFRLSLLALLIASAHAQAADSSTDASAGTGAQPTDIGSPSPDLGSIEAPAVSSYGSAAGAGFSSAHPVDIGGYQTGTVGGGVGTGAFAGNGINLHPFVLKPGISVDVGHDSNVNLGNSQVPVVSSSVALYSPTLALDLNLHGTQKYEAYYVGNYARYTNAQAYNYDDSDVGVSASNIWSSKLSSTLKLDYSLGHDTANSYIGTNAVESWSSPMIQGVVHYGTPDAKGQIEVEADYRQQRYLSDPAVMDTYNLDEARLLGRFIYRVEPKTHAVFELSDQRDIYPNYSGSDASQQRLTGGLQWDATAKTSGSVMVGMMSNQMDTGGSSNTGLSWDASVKYHYRPTTTFSLDSSRSYAEWANLAHAYVVTTGAMLTWDQTWSYRITSQASVLDYHDQYLGSGRDDDRHGFDLAAYYKLGARYRVGLEELYQQRSSNQAINDFNENIVMLKLQAAY